MNGAVALLLAVFLCAAPARAGSPARRAEVSALVERFAAGRVGLAEAASRLAVLDEDAWASRRLCAALAEETDERRRADWLTLLAEVAVRGADVEGVLERALAEQDLGVRMAAIRGIAHAGIVRFVPQLVELLEDPRSGVRREAATALGRLKASAAEAALQRRLEVESDLEARLRAVDALGRLGTRRSWPALARLLASDSESTRFAAARALLRQRAPAGATFAKGLLSSSSDSERLAGAKLYEGVELKLAAPALSPALADSSVAVRATAARVLAQAGDRTKVAWLVRQAATAGPEDRRVLEEAIDALHLTDAERAAALGKAGR